MKRIIGLLLALLMMALVVGCDHNVETNDTKKEVEYSFYSGSGTTGIGNSTASEGFQDAAMLDFMADSIDVTDESKVGSEKVIRIHDLEFNLSYYSSKQLMFGSDAGRSLKANSTVDYYKSDESNALRYYVEIFQETGKIKHFSTFDDDKDKLIPYVKWEEKDLISKAEQVLTELYGDNVMDDYRLERVEYVEDKGRYHVFYTRVMCGYDVDSHLGVYFNHEGTLRTVVGYQHNEYESANHNVTKEMIQNAEAALRAQIPEDRTVQENVTVVQMDTDGKLYLKMYARLNTPIIDSFDGEPNYCVREYFVNIE